MYFICKIIKVVFPEKIMKSIFATLLEVDFTKKIVKISYIHICTYICICICKELFLMSFLRKIREIMYCYLLSSWFHVKFVKSSIVICFQVGFT